MIVTAHAFPKLQIVKDFDDYLKSAVSQHPFTVNMLKGPKYYWNLHESTFIIFFLAFDGSW